MIPDKHIITYRGYQPPPLLTEDLLRWEHELATPDYYDWYLDQVTR